METTTTAANSRQRRERVRSRAEMTGATVCSLSDLLFPVEMRDEVMPANSEFSRMVVGQIEGADFKLNQCSPRYELVPNAEIFPEVERILNMNGIQYRAVYTHIDHVRFYVNYIIEDSRYAYTMKGTNDTIFPKLMVMHSYNGKTKYKIIFGYFRLVCSNGLTIPVQEMKQFNLVIVGKHTEAIKHSFVTLNEMLKFFVTEATQVRTAIGSRYEMLGGRMVTNVQDRVKEVLEAAKITAVENSKFNTLNDIVRRITEEANNTNLGYNGRVNDWLVYNGINQYVNDDNRNIVAPELRMETDSKVLEYLLENA